LRHLAAVDGVTEVPAPGLLGPTGHRKPPHVYSDREIGDLLRAAAGLAPAGGLRPLCYVTLFALLACTGLRIAEALALSCADVDLAEGMLTVRAGKRGRTRLVPLHPTALTPLRDYIAERERRYGVPGHSAAFFRTDYSDRVSYNAANSTFIVLRRHLGWTAPDGELLWVSGVLPGRTVDITAARRFGIAEEVLAFLGLLADLGYIGLHPEAITGYKRKRVEKTLPEAKAANRVQASLRCIGERANAQLKCWGWSPATFGADPASSTRSSRRSRPCST
jgi:hypothetical protein